VPRSPTRIGTGPTTLRGVGRPGASAYHEPHVQVPAGPAPLDPDPAFGEAIRDAHRRAVSTAARDFGADDVEAISDAACLPVWNVKRHLFALGLGPDPTPVVKRKVAGNFGTTGRKAMA
jgi:hypothetical protein